MDFRGPDSALSAGWMDFRWLDGALSAGCVDFRARKSALSPPRRGASPFCEQPAAPVFRAAGAWSSFTSSSARISMAVTLPSRPRILTGALLLAERATITAAVLTLSVAACRTAGIGASATATTSAISVGASVAARTGPWRDLLAGSSLAAWRGYKTDAVPAAWTIANGVLSKERPVADIVSREEWGDFEIEIDWRIGEAGNSGIFYRGTEEYDHIYWTAPEYQLLDDIKGADNKTRLTCAGAAYGLYPSPEGHLKPVGEWNSTRIVARGAHVEHWLNGFKLVSYELWSADWSAKVKASKFSAWPNYGLAKKGRFALQGDHNGTLAFRNIRVREL
jgi:hypothetical protein